MKNVQELVDLLQLEPIEENFFRGKSYGFGIKRVYGGQVLAQALHAATLTVPEERRVHSLHAYFILAGDVEHPIIYQVDRIRDGGSFTTRRVRAIQKGQDIFIMAASYQLEQEGFAHQIDMPNVPSPDALLSDQQIIENHKDSLPKIYQSFLLPRPIEFRPVEKPNFLTPDKGQPMRHVWFKAIGEIETQHALHQQVLAYASDYNLLTTALRPHAVTLDKIMIASLDHAMWFHQEAKVDEWLLYAIDSPSASNARGFTRGNIFNQQGKLVASVVQEGLIRKVSK